MAASVDNNVFDVLSEQSALSPSDPGKMASAPQTPYRFTSDEIRVLRQCNREGFYQRSLPLATLLSVGAYMGVKSGYFKSHARFGPTPKVIIGATIGYFMGKFSYQTKCAEKLMQLPNSPVGEMLRQRKRQGGFQDTLTMDPSFGTGILLPPFSGISPEDRYSDVGPQHDLDSDRPIQEGLNDSFRPTLDTTVLEDDTLPPPGTSMPSTTYEELRRKNREEHEQKKTKQYRGVTNPEDVPSMLHQRSPTQGHVPTPPHSWSKEKNKYGDVWDD